MTLEAEQQKTELKRLFARRLPGKLRQLAALVERLLSAQQVTPLRQQLMLHLDQSRRSCAAFGFTDVADILEKIEKHTSLDDRAALKGLVSDLIEHAETMDGLPATVSAPASPATPLQPLLVWLPEGDERVQVTRELALFGFAALRGQELDSNLPVAAMVDMAHLGAFSTSRLRDVPLVAVSDEGSIRARVEALRFGARAVLARPLDISAVVQALEMITPAASNEPPRVLIVDDSRSQSTYYNKVLTQAGCQTKVVNAPLDIEAALTDLQPEMILLDMQMPDCSGLELARVLKQMPAWSATPVLFLSAEENPEKQAAAMAISGDDFLIKPVPADALSRAVLTRVARARNQMRWLNRDGLTGAINLGTLLQEMDAHCSHHIRTKEALSYAHLDIDQLRHYNSKFGHAAGDRFLQKLTRLLVTRLRRSDIVGRLSGDSFGLLLIGCNGDDALRLLDAVRRDVHGLDEHVQFSVGIANFSGNGGASALRESALAALKSAKAKGGRSAALAP